MLKKLIGLIFTGFYLWLSIWQPGLSVPSVKAQDATESAKESDQEETKDDEKKQEEDHTDELREIESTINELREKINASQQEQRSLASTIQVLNNRILLNEKEIEKTENEIRILELQIEDLSQRISGLELSLGELSQILLSRIQEQYKQSQVDPLTSLLASSGLAGFIREQRYIKRARAHTEDIMLATEVKRQVFDEQKAELEAKQLEVQLLQDRLEGQKNDLASQRAEKQNLLTVTKNDEQVFQRLLVQAEAELRSLRSFATSHGGGVLPPQNSPDGWYFSQRDERWAGLCIGSSCGTNNQGTIYEVGCLIADVAMIKKKYGEDVTPADIARNSSYFFSSTAYMLRPWPAPSGYSYKHLSFNQDTLDSELKADRPVIAHLRVNTGDGHFIVIKEGQDGDYIMHDPWEGYDKKFSDYYSLSQISQLAVLR